VIDFQHGKICREDGTVVATAGMVISELKRREPSIALHQNPYQPETIYAHGLREMVQGEPFGVSLTFVSGQLQRATFVLENGPASSAGWENIDIGLLRAEVSALTEVFSREIGRHPDKKRDMHSEWHFSWGRIAARAETKSFSCALYMTFKE
jgi:hypothetical protein